MRIEKMHIKNYRRFVDTRISFSDKLTVLAGANNSGKTSLIHLLDCVLGNRFTLKPKDISLLSQSKITNKLFNMFNENLETFILTVDNPKELKEQINNLFFDKITTELQIIEDHISIQISVVYDVKENISLFASYLMDLDETKRNFYFEIVQQINPKSLKRNIEGYVDSLQMYLKRYLDALKEQAKCKSENSKATAAQVLKCKQLLIEKLFKLYGDSLEIEYRYANEDFSSSHTMEKKAFVCLFNYNYLSADRKKLTDNVSSGNKTMTSSVVELMNIERKQDTSPKEWKGKVEKILDKMYIAISNENIDTYLVEQAQELLVNISQNLNAIGETNIQEITMVLDMGKDLLYQILNDSIRVSYAIPTDVSASEKVLLPENSQGLGITNLIFITLELMRYKFSLDHRLVNIFVIEEPESHMHLQMQRTLISHLNYEYSDKGGLSNIQGIITTHSDEIVRSANLTDIKVIRPKAPLNNVICDMALFLEKNKAEKTFYETFFKINFSNMIFADKAIIYEGDTERMYIESLIFGTRNEEGQNLEFLKILSQKYITYAQVGGAYAHKYAALLNELEISTLILTDIDYEKSCLSNDSVIESKTTNAALKYFYLLEQQKNETDITISDIYKWQSLCSKENNILVKTQSPLDGYARTLEEAILFQYIKSHQEDLLKDETVKNEFNVFSNLKKEFWIDFKDTTKFSLTIPNRSQEEKDIPSNEIERCIRHIVKSISDKKSDFMYSIIIEGKQYAVMPNYIKEGLEWLAQK